MADETNNGNGNEQNNNSMDNVGGVNLTKGAVSERYRNNNANSSQVQRMNAQESAAARRASEAATRAKTLADQKESKKEQNKANKEAKKQQTELNKLKKKNDEELFNEEMLMRASEREKDEKSLRQRIKDNAKATKEALKEWEEGIANGTIDLSKDGNQEKYNQAKEDAANASAAEFAAKSLETASKALTSSVKALTNSLDNFLDSYSEMYSTINARVQGAYEDMDFESLSSSIKEIVGMSPYINYMDTMENLNKLVEAGTTVNLEERAFLATVSDKVATTFDALDSTLLRIVRLQGADTTDARLGMEASLTRLFNYYFSDTSYLADAFDSVTSALLGLTSSLDAQSGVEYEYVVQKWLGALGSEGADTSTLTSLANAINALAIGDIDTLSSNEGMQNLLIMAANRQGLDFSEMLINTPTQQELNLLMYGVVDYIQEIMEGANNVVKNQYASLFGITYADIAAFTNLNDEMLNDLYQESMSYSDTLVELNSQLNEVANNRTSVKEMVDNVIKNMEAGIALSLFNNQGSYMTWAIAEAMESFTGGIQIPDIFALGSGVNIDATIEDLMKTGVMGVSMISSFMSGFQSWQGTEALNLANWNVNYNKGTYTGYTSTNLMSTTNSNVGTISNTDMTGIQQSMYEEQTTSAEEISGTSLSDSEIMADAVTEIRDWLIDGGDEAKPLAVRNIRRNTTSNLSTLSTNVSTAEEASVEGTDVSSILLQMSEILKELGTQSKPIYVETSEESSIYTMLSSKIPEYKGGSI